VFEDRVEEREQLAHAGYQGYLLRFSSRSQNSLMVEQESRSVRGDPAAEIERCLEEISKAGRKRARYREMAAEGLIDLEELQAHLAALEDTRKTTGRELHALEQRTEHLAQLKRDRDSLLENYADLMPEMIDALGPEERHRVYRMMGLEVHLAPDGSLEISGDVMDFSKLEISST
jgi:septal ring factor EnvC (AmiA/AmiB activator)